jgi:hypothetical protein
VSPTPVLSKRGIGAAAVAGGVATCAASGVAETRTERTVQSLRFMEIPGE